MTQQATATTFNPIATIGHNAPPELPIFQQIDDLYDTARDFADGEPIADDKMEEVITGIYNDLHKLGKQADELRVAEKKPLDDAVSAVQSKYNPYIQPKRGKVDMAKAALGDLLAPYRAAKAAAAAAEAARIAAEAEAARQAANAAIQSSSGNLAAREEAEELLADAKKLERTASRTFKAATTGTGLRTVYDVTLVDESAAMDWLWSRAKDEVLAVAQRNAEEAVRGGVRAVPGFAVVERKVAR